MGKTRTNLIMETLGHVSNVLREETAGLLKDVVELGFSPSTGAERLGEDRGGRHGRSRVVQGVSKKMGRCFAPNFSAS